MWFDLSLLELLCYLIFISFFKKYVYMWVYAQESNAHVGQKRASGSPGAMVSGGSELSIMDAGHGTWVPCEQHVLLTPEPFLQSPSCV